MATTITEVPDNPYWYLDFDKMHGVWVTNIHAPGSYGRIASRHREMAFHILWTVSHRDASIKLRRSSSLMEAKDLRMLAVEPEPWYAKCSHCGERGLPIQYSQVHSATCEIGPHHPGICRKP